MSFVLDASVALLWLAPATNPDGATYAENILHAIRDGEEIFAPNLFALQVANVAAKLESKGIIREADALRYLSLLDQLGIRYVETLPSAAFGQILHLARRHQLSAYDAAYLYLALTQGIGIATLDADLTRAAKEAAIEVAKG